MSDRVANHHVGKAITDIHKLIDLARMGSHVAIVTGDGYNFIHSNAVLGMPLKALIKWVNNKKVHEYVGN